MTKVWESSIPSHLKYTLLALADFSNDAGKCYPSLATIARKCNKSVRQIQRDLANLIQLNLLQRQYRDNTSNVYWLHPRPELLYPPIKLEKVNDEDVNPFNEEIEKSYPQGVTCTSGGGDIKTTPGVTSTSYKPSVNHYQTSKNDPKNSKITTNGQSSYEEYVANRLLSEANIDLYKTMEQRSLQSWIQWLDSRK